jgi:predicted tellurium resistance membrane protein TerC
MLLWVQGVYTLLTALWGLIDIDSFMAVTGPKHDIWLVKTVSVVLLAIAATLLSHLWVRTDPLPALLLGLLTSVGLAAIDFYYSGRGVISPVYALDGVAETLFALVWIYLLFRLKRLQNA